MLLIATLLCVASMVTAFAVNNQGQPRHVRHFAKQDPNRGRYGASSSSQQSSSSSDEVHEGRWARPHANAHFDSDSSAEARVADERGDTGNRQWSRHELARAQQAARVDAANHHQKQDGDRLNYQDLLHKLHAQQAQN